MAGRAVDQPGAADPDDDSHSGKRAKACKNPGQHTGSCKGGPPNADAAAEGEAQQPDSQQPDHADSTLALGMKPWKPRAFRLASA